MGPRPRTNSGTLVEGPEELRKRNEVTLSENSQRKPGQLELLHNGYYYDVTGWVGRHPGGPLIEMYLNNNEDATHAIEQFHFRSTKRVNALLASMPKRKASEEDLLRTWGPEKLKRHRALTEDFSALFKELQEEGLFEPCLPHVLMRYLEIATLCIYGLHIFSHGWTVAGLALICWGCGRSGWFVHEAGHHSFTGRPNVDRWIQSHIYGIYYGLSGACWRNHHSKHHAMPQHIHNDVDLHTLPLMAFHEKVVKNPNQYGFLVKYQKYLIYIVQSSIMGFYWKWVEDPYYAWKGGHYWDLVHMAIHQVFIYKLGFPLYVLSACIILSYMVLNATLSHTHLPITDEPTHWVEYSLVHTANVRSSWWVDYFMGYLNYQIEHHLFPTMPQFRNKLAARRVKALAKKHSLPYHLYDFQTIVSITVKNLANVSKSVEDRMEQDLVQNTNNSDDLANNPVSQELLLSSVTNLNANTEIQGYSSDSQDSRSETPDSGITVEPNWLPEADDLKQKQVHFVLQKDGLVDEILYQR